MEHFRLHFLRPLNPLLGVWFSVCCVCFKRRGHIKYVIKVYDKSTIYKTENTPSGIEI